MTQIQSPDTAPGAVSIEDKEHACVEDVLATHSRLVADLEAQLSWSVAALTTRKRKRSEPAHPLYLCVRTLGGAYACKGALTKGEAIAACFAKFPTLLDPDVRWQDVLSAADPSSDSSADFMVRYRADVLPAEDDEAITGAPLS
jgi:hypothetical protein